MSLKAEVTDGEEILLKAFEVAQKLNISKSFAYKLMQTGEIRIVQIKGARRVRPEDLEEYIISNTQPPLAY